MSLLILRGLQASGKTTFAKRWVNIDIDNRVRVNRDDLRQLLHGQATHLYQQEQAVTAAEHAIIESLLRAKKSVVVDNVNLRSKYVRQYLEIANRLGVPASVKDFEIDLDEAIRRDRLRKVMGERFVGEDVIRDFHERYHLSGGLPEVPVLDEDAAGRLYEPDTTRPCAVVVDIDGTVALHGDRSPYDYDLVFQDEPHKPVISVVKALRQDGFEIVFMSGRPDSCQQDTVRWLHKHIGGRFTGPFMRATGDDRNDSIIKIELFDRYVRPFWNVHMVLDDRNRVVRAWRGIGLTCLQVGDGDF